MLPFMLVIKVPIATPSETTTMPTKISPFGLVIFITVDPIGKLPLTAAVPPFKSKSDLGDIATL